MIITSTKPSKQFRDICRLVGKAVGMNTKQARQTIIQAFYTAKNRPVLRHDSPLHDYIQLVRFACLWVWENMREAIEFRAPVAPLRAAA